MKTLINVRMPVGLKRDFQRVCVDEETNMSRVINRLVLGYTRSRVQSEIESTRPREHAQVSDYRYNPATDIWEREEFSA